jgi:Cu(I)/Ag(I) efflux system membrane protein CusA/SilA
VLLIRGFGWQVLALVSLLLLGVAAWHLPRIGVSYMPALDEGSTLEMPITVPRTSITQVADDLKARDALLRGFPEVESVIGKAGRADTPTDPAPLDMVETFVNYRPKELWPKRVLRYDDANRQTRAVLHTLEERGFVRRADRETDRDALATAATQKALERFDEIQRELALRRYQEFEQRLGPELVRFAVADLIGRFRRAHDLHWPAGTDEAKEIDALAAKLAPGYAEALARHPALEDLTHLSQEVAQHLQAADALADPVAALAPKDPLSRAVNGAADLLGTDRRTLAGEVLRALTDHRAARWRQEVRAADGELFDRGTEAYTWLALEETAQAARDQGLLDGAAHAAESERFAEEAVKAQRGEAHDEAASAPFVPLRQELQKPFAAWVLLWPRQSGPKGDLVDDELGRVLQTPGWTNIFTQPIINRIEMLSTGVRTDIGVKVFGPDLDTIDRVCKQVEAALKPVRGARDVVAAPIMGKGYLEIDVDRERAARYGVSVDDLKNTVEVALGGQAVTQTVEGRERFPVRLRYPRAQREDEESVRNLLVSGSGGAADAGKGMEESPPPNPSAGEHQAAPAHAGKGRGPLQVPLGAVADVRVVEGPSMIPSENGQLLNYVTLNVRDRDLIGFVEEAQRAVDQKVVLPEGVHVEWTGEFENQVRAAHTMRFAFPAVLVLIFVILYLTYRDLADAALMMLAVPEALAGAAFFQFLFPKLLHGWSAPPLEFSVAVWVGYIACCGMATETGIIMLVYLREAIDKRGGLENIKSLEELRQAVIEGAVHRLRPKLLTEGVAILALAPMLWASGAGAEVIAPMAVPVLGGLLISDEVVDIFLPVRFYWVRRARWLKLQAKREAREKRAALARAPEAAAV